VRLRIAPRVAFWAFAALTLLVSHDLVWLVQLGPGESLALALRGEQHGYWSWASLAILGAAIVAALATASRALRLVRRARLLHAPIGRIARYAFLWRAAVAWARLLAAVGIGFAIQENVEHYLAHGHVMGLGALTGPEYPLAIPVLALVSAAAAVACATIRSVERELVAGIAAALHRQPSRAPSRMPPTPSIVPARRRAAMASSAAGRAPPPLLVGT